MSQWTALTGYYTTDPDNRWPWIFGASGSLDAGSNSGVLVFSDGPNFKTRVTGTGLSLAGGAINWTTLTSIEHLASDGSVIERIDNLGSIGANPGSAGPGSSLITLLLSGDDTITGSSGRDFMVGGHGTNTYVSTAGGDYFYGGSGDDTVRILAVSHLGDAHAEGGGGTDTFQLEFAGSYDFIQGTFLNRPLFGFERVKFA
jgi:Ca2+-binding RTX toxin-like protein